MKLMNRNFVISLLVQFWFMMSFFMSQPLVAQFVVNMGESTALAGFVAGIFSILALVFRPVSGFLADRYYRKYVLAFGYVLCVVSYAGYAIAPNAAVVLAFRAVYYFAPLAPAALALLATELWWRRHQPTTSSQEKQPLALFRQAQAAINTIAN